MYLVRILSAQNLDPQNKRIEKQPRFLRSFNFAGSPSAVLLVFHFQTAKRPGRQSPVLDESGNRAADKVLAFYVKQRVSFRLDGTKFRAAMKHDLDHASAVCFFSAAFSSDLAFSEIDFILIVVYFWR